MLLNQYSLYTEDDSNVLKLLGKAENNTKRDVFLRSANVFINKLVELLDRELQETTKENVDEWISNINSLKTCMRPRSKFSNIIKQCQDAQHKALMKHMRENNVMEQLETELSATETTPDGAQLVKTIRLSIKDSRNKSREMPFKLTETKKAITKSHEASVIVELERMGSISQVKLANGRE